MGYVICQGACIKCHRPFSFHPNKVPSMRVNGVREPLCRACVEMANPIRKARGLPEIVILPGAYEEVDENEVNWNA